MLTVRQLRYRCPKLRKRLLITLFILFSLCYIGRHVNYSISSHLLYLVVLSLLPTYVVVNLDNVHQNIKFTSDKIYFVNSLAYDFYSLDEIDGRSKPGQQWKTFPLPNEHIPANITPWFPEKLKRDNTTSDYSYPASQSTTGLAFVDHIYITTTAILTDRQANLKKIFTHHQITNYEWRMKWTRETCNAPENKAEVFEKLNLKGDPLSKITLIIQFFFF